MNKKELFYFVGKCLAMHKHEDFRGEFIRNSNRIDWQEFVALCSDHLILPAIYLRFKEAKVLDNLPEDLVVHLEQIYSLNVIRNQNILRQIKEITELLDENEIRPVFLKGSAYILDRIYSDIGERMMNDIDFLVEEKDYHRCAELLKKSGYEQESATPGYIDVNELKHYPRLVHPEHVAAIEIHRIPVDEDYLGWFNTEQIDMEKVSPKRLSGCFVPSDKHKLIHNFIHSQLSNEGHLYGMISLRSLCDLIQLAERYSLTEALKFISPKRKAIAFFALADSILGEERSFFKPRNRAYYFLKIKHALGLRSKVFRTLFRSTIFFSQRIIGGYILLPISAIFWKKKRQYLVRRLQDNSWLNHHFRLYTHFFNKRL